MCGVPWNEDLVRGAHGRALHRTASEDGTLVLTSSQAGREREVQFLYSHLDFDLESAPIPASVSLILHRGKARRTRGERGPVGGW